MIQTDGHGAVPKKTKIKQLPVARVGRAFVSLADLPLGRVTILLFSCEYN